MQEQRIVAGVESRLTKRKAEDVESLVPEVAELIKETDEFSDSLDSLNNLLSIAEPKIDATKQKARKVRLKMERIATKL